MKKILAFAGIAMVMLFYGTTVLAQDWTKEQTELWKVVEDTWTKWKTGDIDGMAANFHERYQGWSNSAPLPVGKATMMEWYKSMKDMMKVNYVEVQPARITITKDVAVVDYYFTLNTTTKVNEEAKTEDSSGKNVEFYLKENGKWLLIGDMTYFEVKDDD